MLEPDGCHARRSRSDHPVTIELPGHPGGIHRERLASAGWTDTYHQAGAALRQVPHEVRLVVANGGMRLEGGAQRLPMNHGSALVLAPLP